MFKNTTPIRCPKQSLCASGTVWLVKRFALALKPIRARCPSLGSMHSYFPIVFVNSSWPRTTEVLKCYLIFKSGSDHTYAWICMLDISGHLILNRSSMNLPIPARQEVASPECTRPPDVDVLRFLQRWRWGKTAEGREGSFSLRAGVKKAVLVEICRKLREDSTLKCFKGGKEAGLPLLTIKGGCCCCSVSNI